MKFNQPVTQIERFFDPGRPVVTKTDLKGRITYVNDAFVTISGFSHDELIGASHNIVRHPEMPPAAFADLWRTIQAGYPWRGIVKNRSKDGGFYWVDAYVTPITENGRIVGYTSVRNAPDRAKVAVAEAAYRAVNAGLGKLPATRLPVPVKWYRWPLIAGGIGLASVAAVVGGFAGAAFGTLAVMIAVAFGAAVNWVFIRPLQRIEDVVRNIDEGRLDRSIDASGIHGVLYSRLEALRIHLRAVFADVLVSSREMHERAVHLEGAIRALHISAEKQGQRIEAIAAAMEQMSVSISEISGNSESSLLAVARMETAVQSGLACTASSVDSSRKVVDVVVGSKEAISQVNQSINRIASISRIIDGIAQQTNLLALNAAIEAARAGDHGRGFSVVADEVRKLSESTRQSTVEIAGVIEDIVQRSRGAVDAMANVASQVNVGTAQIEENGSVLQEIWRTSQNSATCSREIKDMLVQQTSTSQDIANNMEQISAAMEASSGSVQAVSEVSSRLRRISEDLRLLISHIDCGLNSDSPGHENNKTGSI